MKSRAGIAGHPIHAMLVPFPIALWIFSLASDFIYLFGFGGPVWKDIAFYTIVGRSRWRPRRCRARVPRLSHHHRATDSEDCGAAYAH